MISVIVKWCEICSCLLCMMISALRFWWHLWVAHYYYYYYYYLLLHLFSGLFSGTAWLSWHQKGKPFWSLLEQEMMGWQWHQLDHMQIICTSLQTDNHASSTSPLSFYRPDALLPPNQQHQSTEGRSVSGTLYAVICFSLIHFTNSHCTVAGKQVTSIIYRSWSQTVIL